MLHSEQDGPLAKRQKLGSVAEDTTAAVQQQRSRIFAPYRVTSYIPCRRYKVLVLTATCRP